MANKTTSEITVSTKSHTETIVARQFDRLMPRSGRQRVHLAHCLAGKKKNGLCSHE